MLGGRSVDWQQRIYAAMLYAYPREFRARFGTEMQQVFRERRRAALAEHEPAALVRFWLAMTRDWMLSSGRERMASMSATWNHRLWRAARGVAFAVLTVAICVTASAPFMRAYVIPSASMEGSLLIGDHVIVNKFGVGREVRRDELVTLRYPVDPKQTFVKRVIGIPGDHIRLVDKQVIRNGRRLVEPYVRHNSADTDAYLDNFPGAPNTLLREQGLDMLAHHVSDGEVVVPEGSLFVLGDNRDDSIDSRYWGFVPRANVIGQPVFVYWSYDAAASKTRWGRTFHVLK
jgi:signal peptidase I